MGMTLLYLLSAKFNIALLVKADFYHIFDLVMGKLAIVRSVLFVTWPGAVEGYKFALVRLPGGPFC